MESFLLSWKIAYTAFSNAVIAGLNLPFTLARKGTTTAFTTNPDFTTQVFPWDLFKSR